MPEYDIAFGSKLVDTARLVAAQDLINLDAKRAVLYLCLLSSEITLKALLERAGMPVGEIVKRKHSLSALLSDLDKCQICVEVVPGNCRWALASSVRALVVDSRFSNATVGTILEAEVKGASKFPNQIRYGNSLKHHSPELLIGMASELTRWARKYWETIRY
jgi:HEPN domain-containing protein